MLRSFKRNKLYSIITVLGLSLGFAACMLIVLFIEKEYQFDRFHQYSSTIVRFTTDIVNDAKHERKAYSPAPLSPLLKQDFSGIQAITRLYPYEVSAEIESNGRKQRFQEKKFFFADSAVFDVFSFQAVQGSLGNALQEPFLLILTKSASERYFGSANAVGQTLTIEGKFIFRVHAVIADIPSNSSIQCDMLASMSSVDAVVGTWVLNSSRSWHFPYMYTFARLNAPEGASTIQAALPAFTRKHRGNDAATMSFRVQPLTDIHFTPNLEQELAPTTTKEYLVLLSVLAGFILFIACINFINLSTARSQERMKEIGIHKVLGAHRQYLRNKIIAEFVFYTMISFLLALLLVEVFLPSFGAFTHQQYALSDKPILLLIMFGISVLVGVIAAIYPAFAYTRVETISILRRNIGSNLSRRGMINLRFTLVVLQFGIAIILITATFIIQQQRRYIQQKDIGFQRENVLVIPIRDDDVQEKFSTVKQAFLSVKGVQAVSALANFPWEKGFYDFQTTVSGAGKSVQLNAPTVIVEHDFIKVLGMSLADGRDFFSHQPSDKEHSFLLNETAAKNLGFQGLGATVTMEHIARGNAKNGTVIGIVKDIHLQSLHHAVEPLLLTIAPESYYLDNIIVRIQSDQVSETLAMLEEHWQTFAPHRPFDYFFLDEAFDKLYRKESELATIFNVFTALALLIACLGLFALAAYSTERRTKEIGIRKVLGASVVGIIGLLSRDFLKPVILALVVSLPVAWLGANKWLQGFAYRTELSWWFFAVSGCAAVVIAFLTVAAQAWKVARANPVKSLRYE